MNVQIFILLSRDIKLQEIIHIVLIGKKEYTNMLSYYKKRENELKKLDEDNDDAYLNQPWADTR